MKNNNENIKEISEWLERLVFRKQFFAGVSEQDVWKKISELDIMYQEALKAERIRYETLLDHYENTGEKPQGGDMAHD